MYDYRRHRISSCAADYADQISGPGSDDHSDAGETKLFLTFSDSSVSATGARCWRSSATGSAQTACCYLIRYAIEEILE